VDRGETILLDDLLGDQDGVLEVVAIPRHERDAQVLAQRKLAHIGGRTVGQHVTARDLVTDHEPADAG
jgi:hypothetical protein